MRLYPSNQPTNRNILRRPNHPKSNNMTRLLLVRHGETDWNKQKRIQGQTDVPLNDLGLAQAEAVGRALASEKEIAAVWVSDRQRAWQTAEAIMAHHPNHTMKPEPRMREMIFFFSGRPMELLK